MNLDFFPFKQIFGRPKLDRQRPLIRVLQDAWNLSAVPRVSVVIVRRSVQLPPEAFLSLTMKTDSERIASWPFIHHETHLPSSVCNALNNDCSVCWTVWACLSTDAPLNPGNTHTHTHSGSIACSHTCSVIHHNSSLLQFLHPPHLLSPHTGFTPLCRFFSRLKGQGASASDVACGRKEVQGRRDKVAIQRSVTDPPAHLHRRCCFPAAEALSSCC